MKTFLLPPWIAILSFSPTLSSAAEIDLNDDLFWRYSLESQEYTAQEIQSQNRQALKEQAAIPASKRNPKRISEVSEELAEEILNAVEYHPVASLGLLGKYDPQGGIGFCFGRAMTAHLEALSQGVLKESVMKAWVHGDLRADGIRWRYHVTSLLKGPGKTWWAVDPIMGYVMPVSQWYREMQRYDYDGKMKIYFTRAEKFGPSGGKYAKNDILHEFYNSYFQDLLAYYRKLHSQKTQR